MNYYTTTFEENTIACRNNGADIEVHGSGSYIGKPAVVEVLEERDGFVLQRTNNSYTGKATFKLTQRVDGKVTAESDDDNVAYATVKGGSKIVANRWDGANGETGILGWNADDKPATVSISFGGTFVSASEPERGEVDADEPIPANTLRLCRYR